MMREYPDALVVHTHRDPLRVVCSLASLIDLLRRLASDDVSIAAVAHEWVDDIAVGLDRAVAARRDGTIPATQAVDVFFGDFLADPMAVVGEIYDRLGIELTTEADGSHATVPGGQSPGEAWRTCLHLRRHGARRRDVARTDAPVPGILRRP